MRIHPGRCRGPVGRLLLAAGLALAAAPATASAASAGPRPDDVSNPEHFRCVGRNRYSGAINIPEEKQSETGAWSYAVMLVDPVLGKPIIIYGPRFREVSPLMQAFIRRHECQHANGVVDEIAANCVALVQMRAQGLTPEQEAQLERWHLNEGRLDPQYGGSGAAFWERTLRCAATVR
jgi:hypothetical protein